MRKSIYKYPDAKKNIQSFYTNKLKSLDFPYEEIDVPTAYGRTRVIIAGNEHGKKVVLFHGVHAGAPLTLETVKVLREQYSLIAIDTIGQATMSDETVLNLKDDSFARWADDVLAELSIEKADFIGISYGAFILQKLMTYRPNRVEKCIFVVPSGLANGAFWPSFTKLSVPLIRWNITKKDQDLRKFVSAFAHPNDTYMFQFQKAILSGLYMDYRRPSILTQKDVRHFKKPVYLLAAEHDIFFPADKTIKQAYKVFENLQETHLLKGGKHIPYGEHITEIREKIAIWLADEKVHQEDMTQHFQFTGMIDKE